ncbi:Ku protein [Streptomyces sp. JV185]|uniref:non-homologous end joining protein Ku n=1 Tax=Streptomyces sp. JV185 TaxID=858638 RepID=UPI002E79096C|nr:Ku protein [Streptomyces sp. JV185]MEE1767126.1 Ku protein [Streptomyces sp. JV185]
MARPVWTGIVSFGLVSLSVALYAATDSHTIRFHQLQRGTADRIRNRRVNERAGDEVELDEIVKGYDTGGEYVTVEPEELDDIAPGRSRALEVSEFVDLDTVEPVFFDKTYYLGPRGEQYGKVYALLQRALEESSKVGIATFVMRGREYLVALKAQDGLLAPAHPALGGRDTRPSQRGPRPAGEDGADPGRGEDDPPAHRRPHRRLGSGGLPRHLPGEGRGADRGQGRRRGRGEGRAGAQPTGMVDLMEALRASVERARSPKDTGEKAGASDKTGRGKKPAAKKHTKASDIGSLRSVLVKLPEL